MYTYNKYQKKPLLPPTTAPRKASALEPRANVATESLPRPRGWRAANGRVNPQGSQRRGFPRPQPRDGTLQPRALFGGQPTRVKPPQTSQ